MPIFVGGTGRSGTTILSKILGSHSQIYRPSYRVRKKVDTPELRFIIDPDGCIDLVNNLSTLWSPQRADTAIRRFLMLFDTIMKDVTTFGIYWRRILFTNLSKLGIRGPRYSKLFLGKVFNKKKIKVGLDELISDITDNEFSGEWGGSISWRFKPKIYTTHQFSKEVIAKRIGKFVNSIFEPLLQRNNKTLWIDSTPYNILHAEELLTIFPKSKFIHIYRDPRDVLSSMLTKKWGGKEVSDTISWIQNIWSGWKIMKDSLDPNTFIEIKMEDMIQNQEEEISNILEFLNLQVEEKVVHTNLLKSGNIGRWNTHFNKQQQNYIQGRFEELLEKLGYD